MNHLSIMVKELTDELNNIVADIENEEDEDNIMTMRFRAGVILECIKKLIKGGPIVRYDSKINKSYFLYPDGRREYESNC